MKYYLDTEFMERPCTIDLISIGIVRDDGKEMYAISDEFDESLANDFVREHVLPHLKGTRSSLDHIRKSVLDFVIGDDSPEFWGYYADYDWVVFCWLFGSMIDLPKGWPMYCRDLKQVADGLGNPQLPPNTMGHNAICDARWNKVAHEYLIEYSKIQRAACGDPPEPTADSAPQ